MGMQCKRGGLRFTLCHGPAPQQATSGQSPEARTHGGPELARSEHVANKERTHGGTHMRQTEEADKV